MKLFIFLIFISNLGYGNCIDDLYKGNNSFPHKVSLEEDYLDNNSAKKAVGKLLETYSCETKTLDNPVCREIIRGVRESLVCYTHSNQGYFLIQKDYFNNINILVNRWD